MTYYDIELIDISDNVENFVFERVSSDDLEKLISDFKEKVGFLTFSARDQKVILDSNFFRGVLYTPHYEKPKSVVEETLESAEILGNIKSKKQEVKPKLKPKKEV